MGLLRDMGVAYMDESATFLGFSELNWEFDMLAKGFGVCDQLCGMFDY